LTTQHKIYHIQYLKNVVVNQDMRGPSQSTFKQHNMHMEEKQYVRVYGNHQRKTGHQEVSR
jgi:hypothetical protein